MREQGETRGERRALRREKRRGAMRMHGASLRRIYEAAVRKRARRARKTDEAGPGEAGRGGDHPEGGGH